MKCKTREYLTAYEVAHVLTPIERSEYHWKEGWESFGKIGVAEELDKRCNLLDAYEKSIMHKTPIGFTFTKRFNNENPYVQKLETQVSQSWKFHEETPPKKDLKSIESLLETEEFSRELA